MSDTPPKPEVSAEARACAKREVQYWLCNAKDNPMGKDDDLGKEVQLAITTATARLEKERRDNADAFERAAKECEKLQQQVGELKEKCQAWALGVEQSNTDIVDMQRDEFKRIIALTDNEEIKGLCERAIATIEQRVPVVVQRDKLQDEVYTQQQTILHLEATVAVMKDVLIKAQTALSSLYVVPTNSEGAEALELFRSTVDDALSQSAPTDMLGKLGDAIRLLLPMAKGYAHSKQVDSNWKMIETAEQVLELLPSEKV